MIDEKRKIRIIMILGIFFIITGLIVSGVVIYTKEMSEVLSFGLASIIIGILFIETYFEKRKKTVPCNTLKVKEQTDL